MRLIAGEMEKAVLRLALGDDRAADLLVAQLEPGAITDRRLAQVESILRDGVRGFEAIASRMLDAGADAQLVGDLSPEGDPQHIGWHIAELNDRLALRKGRTAIAEALKRMKSETTPDGAKAALLEMAGKVTGAVGGAGEKEATEREGLIQIVEEFESRMEGDAPELLATFPALDEHIGGLDAGDLAIVGAETSGGKTAFAISLAAQAMTRGKGCAYFSLEMPSKQIRQRFLSVSGSVPSQLMRAGIPSKMECGRLMEGVNTMGRWKLASINAIGWHISQIEARAAALKAQGRADLIVIDYVQLVGGDGFSREQEVANVSSRLKKLAGDLGCPVLGLSQLNEDGRVRESRAIAMDADFALILNSESGEVEIAKNRHGPRVRAVYLDFIGKYARWQDAS